MDIDMLLGFGHVAWIRTCCTDMNMLHRYRQVAYVDTVMFHGYGYVAWTWARTLTLTLLRDPDMNTDSDMDTDMDKATRKAHYCR
jgi:hypothetical protein